MREMKDSGIEWIGTIPNNWSVIKSKYVATIIRGGSPRPIDQFYSNDDFGFNWIKIGDTTKHSKYISNTQFKIISAGLSKTRFVRKGTLLLTNSMSFGEPYILDLDGCIHDGWVAFFDYRGVAKEYLYYSLFSSSSKQQFEFISDGGVVQNLNIDKIGNCFMCLPDLFEQKAIADFLDNECDELNTLISDIQSQIEALEEYKRSVITEAVTKGLDPDVEMRDSGIVWVGDIPAHWITHPLYFYFGERKNKNALGLETNLLSLSYGKIIRKDINSNGGLLPESFNTYNIIEKDDIIIRPTDLQNDKRSLRTGIAREHGIITSAYIAMKAIKAVNPEYFHYLLHAYDVMKVFYNMGNGVRQGLNFSEFSRLMVFEPTIEEQNAIVAYLKEKCDEIDLAIAEKKQQIETIEEYKKSLIFEYVTGKKEVQA